jgi:hypothetical protein
MPLELQSVVFDKKKWTQAKAEAWLRDNGYKTSFYGKKVDERPTQWRYRQTAPSRYRNYVSKKLPNNVLLVLGIKNA